jgi:hypothetical protein
MFDGKGVHVVMTSSAAIILLIRPSKLNRSHARATDPTRSAGKVVATIPIRRHRWLGQASKQLIRLHPPLTGGTSRTKSSAHHMRVRRVFTNFLDSPRPINTLGRSPAST